MNSSRLPQRIKLKLPSSFGMQKENPVAKNRNSLRRRSKSTSDLSTLKNSMPLGNRGSVKSSSSSSKTQQLKETDKKVFKPLNTIKEKTAIKPVISTASISAVKRPASKETESTKPKMLKIAPYDYKARFERLLKDYKELKGNYTALSENSASLTEENERLSDELNLLIPEKQKLLGDNQQLQIKCTDFEVDVQKLELQMKKDNLAFIKLKTDFEIISGKYSESDKRNQKLQEDNKILQSKCNDLEIEVGNLRMQLKENNLTITKFKTSFDESYSKCKQLEICHLELQSQFEQISNEKEELINKLESAQKLIIDNDNNRRNMHNMIQDLKGNIRVFCRIRPALHTENDRVLCSLNVLDEVGLEIRKSRDTISATGRTVDSKQEFSFDKVFGPESTQEDVFEDLAQLVQSALDGFNVCVFAYGQTGSGKTYTMQGTNNNLGMIPKTIKLLFKKIDLMKSQDWTYSMEASFLEIYNETIKDLLVVNNKEKLEILHNDGKGSTVRNLTKEKIQSKEHLFELIKKANCNRIVATTCFNEHSSRSHAVTKLEVVGANSQTKIHLQGSINLVDLAGSENAKFSERIVETKNINKSLSNLGTVMSALLNKDSYVPYRNSKLTYLLQSSLGGNSKTLMFVNISPFEDCYAETINSLRFASKVKDVKTAARRQKLTK